VDVVKHTLMANRPFEVFYTFKIPCKGFPRLRAYTDRHGQ
jgi:hypothetical protein